MKLSGVTTVTLLVLAAVAVAGYVGWRFALQRGPAADAALYSGSAQARSTGADRLSVSVDQADRTVVPATRIEALEAQMSVLQAQIGELTTLMSERAGDPTADVPVADAEPAEPFNLDARIAAIDELGAAEGVDTGWAGAAESQLVASFQGLADAGLSVSEIRCMSSYCKAGVNIDMERLDAVVDQLESFNPWPSQMMFYVEDQQTGKSVIYLSKEGEALPGFEETRSDS